jgi:YD repeat-containing protein
MLKTTTGPTSAAGTSQSTTTIYDLFGRVVGQKSTGNNGWTCTTYDARGRTTSVAHSAVGALPARTASFSYVSAGGDPLTTSAQDPTGTVATVSDLLGRPVSYTDVWGTVTTSLYDQVGRLVSATATPPNSSDQPQTESYTYNVDSQITQVNFATGTSTPMGITSVACC